MSQNSSESVTIDKLYELFKMGMESNQQYLKQNQEQFQRVHESMSQMADKVSELTSTVTVLVKTQEKDQHEKERLYERIEKLESECDEVKDDLHAHKLQYATDMKDQAKADGKSSTQLALLWTGGGAFLLLTAKYLFDLITKGAGS